MTGGSMPRVAVVVPVHRRHDHLRHLLDSLSRGGRRPDLVVLVAMADDLDDLVGVPGWGEHVQVVAQAVPPEGLPLAAARNAGARTAFEHGVDVLVGLDVDLLAGPGLVEAYRDAVARHPGIVWSGPVTYLPPPPPEGYDLGRLSEVDSPHPARPDPGPGVLLPGAEPDLFWSLSFACSRAAWQRVGGFCEDYVGYGAEDTDFGWTVAHHGVGLGWVGDARGYHQHHPVSDPPFEHVEAIVRNGAVFADRWGRWPMEGWLRGLEEQGLVVRRGDGWARA